MKGSPLRRAGGLTSRSGGDLRWDTTSMSELTGNEQDRLADGHGGPDHATGRAADQGMAGQARWRTAGTSWLTCGPRTPRTWTRVSAAR